MLTPILHLDLDRVAELQRGAHGTQRVVLVHLRHAEYGHHGVADEFLHRAAVTLIAARAVSK